jgi:hypothetical protein
MEIIQKIKNHLNENARHFIEVYNVVTEQAIDKMLFLDEIKEKYESIDGYFTHLLKKGIDKLQVQMRYKAGNAGRKMGLAMPLNLSPADQAPEKIHQSHNGLGFPSQQNTSTMRDSDITQEYVFKQRIQDLEERILDYKQRISEGNDDKRELNRKLQDAYDEIRELKVKVATADKEKELALREAEVSRKSFLDSAAAKEGIKSLSGIFLPSGTPQQQDYSQLNGAQQLSKIKKDLIHWISEGITDEGCDILYKAATQMALHHSEFTPKLLELINEYQSKSN